MKPVSPLRTPQFFLVGRILSRNDSATVLKLKLDDGTGTIEIVYYLEDSGNELVSLGWVPIHPLLQT